MVPYGTYHLLREPGNSIDESIAVRETEVDVYLDLLV